MGSDSGSRPRFDALDVDTGCVLQVTGAMVRGTARLGELLGRGAVGRVFAVSGDRWSCAKVFDRPDDLLAGKVGELVEKYGRGELSARTATWPKGLLRDADGVVVGYLMDRVRKAVPLSGVAADPDVGLADRARLAASFARRVAECHGGTGDSTERRIVVGDVSLANAVRDPRTDEARLVDVDAFQVASASGGRRRLFPVREQRCPSPETAGRTLGRIVLTSRNDNYLCAAACFELLLGCDPLLDDAAEEESVHETHARVVGARAYPYLSLVSSLLVPPPEQVVGPRLADLFSRAFVGPYEDVPSASALAEALGELAGTAIARCPACGEEYRAEGGNACPYCETQRQFERAAGTRLAPAPRLRQEGDAGERDVPSEGGGIAWYRVALAVVVLLAVSLALSQADGRIGMLVLVVGVTALAAILLAFRG